MRIKDGILYQINDEDIQNEELIIPNNVHTIAERFNHTPCKIKDKIKTIRMPSVRWINEDSIQNFKFLRRVYMPRILRVGIDNFVRCPSLPYPNKVIRKDILEEVIFCLENYKEHGICLHLRESLPYIMSEYKVAINESKCFKLFTYENAKKYFEVTGERGDYWWPEENRQVRIDFIEWCYKNDKTK